MAMEVVTGKRGEIHVTSAQAQGLNAGIFGTDAVVLNVADNLEATVISNNLIRVGAGHLINQGVQSCINHGEYEELAITSGTSSTSRIDLICAHYTKDGSTGVEDVELVVIAGTPVTTGTPEAPSVTRGNIINGALEDYCPLHKVLIKGLNIESVELVPPIAGINQIDEKLEEVEKSIDDLAYVKIQGANEFEYDESKINAKIESYTYSKTQIDSKFANTVHLTKIPLPLFEGLNGYTLTDDACNNCFYILDRRMIIFTLEFEAKHIPKAYKEIAKLNSTTLALSKSLASPYKIMPKYPMVLNGYGDYGDNTVTPMVIPQYPGTSDETAVIATTSVGSSASSDASAIWVTGFYFVA